MTVINNQQRFLNTEGSINGEMQIHDGDYYNNLAIDKGAVLNNWI